MSEIKSTCDCCAFWTESLRYSDGRLDGMRACSHGSFTDQDTGWAWETDSERESMLREVERRNTSAVLYEYREGGRQFTGPKFGCIHWKQVE